MGRRLTAILAADVVGYSRLMGADEAGTLAAVKALRKELFAPKVAEHHGRIVKLMGDGALVEFPSVVHAVQCAVEVQRALAERNAGTPEDGRIELRIGVNLGDVIAEGGDIYGDGVNVAARLEELAEPGGIALSGSAHDHVMGKVDFAFEDAGEHDLKNIARPVRVYRWSDATADPVPGTAGAEDALPLPDKPSIAVLPFVNMSGDAEQEYFSDGITEDIITELARFRSLFVIARNSSFSFKGQAIEAREIARRLGVRYLVEGSVRRAGNRVRITAQLIDAAHDTHLWAERYDRELDDIFAVQDEVTRAIVAAIEPELVSAERARARRKPPSNMDAWEWCQRGLWHVYHYTAGECATAQEMFHRSIELDPGFAQPHAGLAYAIFAELLLGFVSDPGDRLTRAHEAAKTAVTLDDKDSFSHYVLGRVCTMLGDHDAAIEAQDVAVALNPNSALAHYGRGHVLTLIGRAEESLDAIDEALRLSPRDPLAFGMMAMRSFALNLLHRHEEAVEWARRGQRQPNADHVFWLHAQEATALAHLGRVDEARAALARVHALNPNFSASFIDAVTPLRNPADRDHFIDGLRKAGLPE
jgi:adenylate cyclase